MPDPVMSNFDAPNGDFACARRMRSNTPLAALATLNEPIFVEAARALALRILREGGRDDVQRADYAFFLCTSRQPTTEERDAILDLVQSRRRRLADGWLNVREVATGDPARLPEMPAETTPQDAAAWTLAARVLLNLDETISKKMNATMNLTRELQQAQAQFLSRRWFLRDCGIGLAGIAAGSLLASEAGAKTPRAQNPLTPRKPHFAAKAKRVIYIFQAGAPSHLELFDNKPELARHDGQLPPAELLKGYRAAFINPNSALLGPKFKFARHGQCGMELSEVLPHTAKIADELCLIRTMQTEAVNHAPAQIMMNSGSQQFGRPSFGSWTLYGLGSESADLPGFVVLTSAKGTSGGASNYGCGFLPTMYGGTPFRSAGDPVLYLSNPSGIDMETQRSSLDTLNRLNDLALQSSFDPEIAARIQSYEMAYQAADERPGTHGPQQGIPPDA